MRIPFLYPTEGRPGRAHWGALSIAAIVGVYVVGHLAGLAPKGASGFQAADLGVLELLCVVAAWTVLRASGRVDFPAPFRRGLRWIAAGLVCQALGGMLLITSMVGVGPAHAMGLVANAMFAAADTSTLVGLFSLPPTSRPRRRRLRALIDATVFIAGIGVPFALLSIQPQWTGLKVGAVLPVLVIPIVDFLGLLAVSWTIETRQVLPNRRAFGCLMGGIGLIYLATVVLSIDRAYNVIPGGTIRWINAANAIAFSLYLLGAWLMRTDPISADDARPLVAFSPLPLITIIVEVAFLIVLLFISPMNVPLLARMLLCLGGVLLLLLARETYVIHDSMRLLASDTHEEEQSRFEGLVRHSSDVVVVVDHNRRVGFASPTAATVLGVQAQALVGHDFLEFIHPEDRRAGEVFFDELILDRLATRTIRWRMASADGVYRDLETAGSNRLLEPAIAGLVLNSRDVTDRNALEEKLHRARKMEAIGRLAGGMAHDFNNLLTIILANAELALMEIGAADKARHDVEEIQRAASRGAVLTGRMLAFSRTGKIKPRAVMVKDLAADAAPLLERSVGEGIRLTMRVDPACGGVKVDPDEFVHAMINLATNARDAMAENGAITVAFYPATLGARPADSYLDAAPGPYIVAEVADNGTGMDEETRARAFEPFFTTKGRSRGTGLGLASVYGMVKAAGGGISLRTSKGAGTTIQLWLPAVPASAVTKPAGAPAAARRGSETILLLEDETAVREALQRTLVAAGYTVHTAGDADEALAVYRRVSGAVDLLVTDVILPGRSGPQLARELRLLQPDLKVLFISGYTGPHLADSDSIPAGALFLAKPFPIEKLTSMVQATLAGKESGPQEASG